MQFCGNILLCLPQKYGALRARLIRAFISGDYGYYRVPGYKPQYTKFTQYPHNKILWVPMSYDVFIDETALHIVTYSNS